MMHIKQFFKHILQKTALYDPVRNYMVKKGQAMELLKWERNGKLAPSPHIVKQRTLRNYSNKFGIKILVETGTYYGDMVEAMKRDFNYIYSIELSRELYEKAKRRFKNEERIELIHGDSSTALGGIVNRIDQTALFWLDGHYSGGVTAKGEKDTPIYEELNHILSDKNKKHVIIIDDARHFGTHPAYPSIAEISEFIKSKRPDTYITVQDDSIRIVPL